MTLCSVLESADAVLLGPGLDNPDATRAALHAIIGARVDRLMLDAFALGYLPSFDLYLLPDELLINANEEEAALLLERDLGNDHHADILEIASRCCSVVHCFGVVATLDGRSWQTEPGGSGLGTAGSGDVLSGAITASLLCGWMPRGRRFGAAGPMLAPATACRSGSGSASSRGIS